MRSACGEESGNEDLPADAAAGSSPDPKARRKDGVRAGEPQGETPCVLTESVEDYSKLNSARRFCSQQLSLLELQTGRSSP